MNQPNFTVQALDAIRPGSEWILKGEEIIWQEVQDAEGNTVVITPNFEWQDEVQTKPTEEELEAAIKLVKKVWKNKEYQRLREPEYPSLAALADAIYWQSQGDDSKMQEYLSAVQAVKNKYPKGEA